MGQGQRHPRLDVRPDRRLLGAIIGVVRPRLKGSAHSIQPSHPLGGGRTALTTVGHGGQTKDALGVEAIDVLADRGYFSGEEILACNALGVTLYGPRPLTSGANADDQFGKQDFVNLPKQDVRTARQG